MIRSMDTMSLRPATSKTRFLGLRLIMPSEPVYSGCNCDGTLQIRPKNWVGLSNAAGTYLEDLITRRSFRMLCKALCIVTVVGVRRPRQHQLPRGEASNHLVRISLKELRRLRRANGNILLRIVLAPARRSTFSCRCNLSSKPLASV